MSNRLKESPEYVRLSLAAAMTLQFVSGKFYRDAKLYCINLLLTYRAGCVANCSYCGLSRRRKGAYQDKSFIRVDWPTYPLKKVIERLNNGYANHVERICVSMITHKRAAEDTLIIIRSLKQATELPLSLLINPTVINELDLINFKEAGVDMVGVAIDTATKELFDLHRGVGVKGPHKWEKYWATLERVRDVFGKDKFGAHLIVGLGEKEQDMVKVIQRVKDLGGRTHLFSFYPERGSALEGKEPAEVGQFRRIQLARYLIDHGIAKASKMRFDAFGRILDFGLNKNELEDIIHSGEPFRTSGCPGNSKESACNRPFGDGPPSDIRSFPFKLTKKDIKMVRRQMRNGI